MVEFRWIIFSLFLMLLFSFTDSASRPYTVRVGDEVTLSCGNLIEDQETCNRTAWAFREFGKQVVTLVERGQIHKEAKTKSDRLNVTENCSLVIKKVTVQDAGYHTCKQSKSEQRNDTNVYLSVVTMTEHEDAGQVTLNCSVSPRGWCRQTVKWLFEGKDVNKDNKDMETSQSNCSAAVTFPTSYFKQKSEYHKLFKCETIDLFIHKMQQFNFSRQSLGEKTDDDATTATTKSPTTTKSTSATRNKWTSVTMSPAGRTNKTSTDSNNGTKPEGWWWIIIVSVGVAAIIVAVIRWKRTKGNKTQRDENMSQNLNPAVTQSAPETSEDTADPEDGVSYASISYIKKTNSRAQVRGHHDDDDEGDTVTYSTVKVASSSAAASTDPSSLYAAVNKPDR